MGSRNSAKGKGPVGRWTRMTLRPGRFITLIFLLLAVTSCVRARTAGLHPPDPPTFTAYIERSVVIPGKTNAPAVEGYVVRPKEPGRYPCAVLLHGKGGWWQAYIRYARELAGRGIASIIVDYYSAHYVDMEGLHVPFPQRRRQFELQNEDIYRVTESFAKRPFCLGGQVGLIGFSMGADKAIRTAAVRPEVKAVVGYYGPYDYIEFIRHRVNPLLLALAPEDALKWKSYMEKNSPVFLAERVRANVLLFHGAEDRTVPMQQSVRMIKALNGNGNRKAEMKLYEGVGHNFVLRFRKQGPERQDSLRRVISFLKKTLVGSAQL